MSWEPITLEELKNLGRRIDTDMVCANSVEDMYLQLNTNYGHEKWTTLRSPCWIGEKLVVMVVKPREE